MTLASFTSVPVPAGSEVVLAVAGDWVACLESSDAFFLSVDHGSAAYFEAGLYWRPAVRFGAVRLINRSGVDNTLSILVGDGHFEDRRAISAGGGAAGIDPATVGDVRSYAFRGQRTCAPAAGELGHLQIWNPVGSGVLGAIRALYLHSDVAGQIVLFRTATELGTVAGAPHSAYFGDPDGALRWRETKQVASISSADTPPNLLTIRVQADGTAQVPFQSPLLIPEGWGLVARHNEVGPLDFDLGFDLLELAPI